jgi:large subunit ribosomal protein L24
MAAKIVTGDEVLVIHGRSKGARGKVRRNLIKEDKLIVEGVNLIRKHVPRDPRRRQSGIIELEAPLHRSKVMLICPSCGAPTRVGFRLIDDGEKVRICKQCDAEIPRPARA